MTLPPIDAHKQQNNNLLAKRRTDSEESFARKLDNMLLLPGGANAEHLQTPRVEKRSRFVEQFTHFFGILLGPRLREYPDTQW